MAFTMSKSSDLCFKHWESNNCKNHQFLLKSSSNFRKQNKTNNNNNKKQVLRVGAKMQPFEY